MEKELSLQEAAKILDVDRTTLFRWVKNGKISAKKRIEGKREVWVIPLSALSPASSLGSKVDLNALMSEWEKKLASGYHTGKPVSQKTITDYAAAFKNYWKYLNVAPNQKFITPEHLKVAISNIPVDVESKSCHFATKEKIYNAFRSFYKLLVEKRLRSQTDFEAIREAKPRRVYEARKTVLRDDQWRKFLEVNEENFAGRTEFDIQLNKTLVMLLAYAGLRRNEAINLKLNDVDIDNGIINVVDGKGHKNRKLGIMPELGQQLLLWINEYRPNSSNLNFLLQHTGKPITRECINKRIQTLRKRAKVDITPHGLRRTFATQMEKRRMPWSYIQKALGHGSIKTTEGYILSDEQQMIEWMKKLDLEQNTTNIQESRLTEELLERLNAAF